MAAAFERKTPSARGEQTRRRILGVALAAFARDGFDGATTRRIAKAAGVNLPAIAYYFDNKEGLYRACAHDIVARYQNGIGAVVTDAARETPNLDPAAARERLKTIMRMLAAIGEDAQETKASTAFVLREMTEQGPAFEILYEDLWRPGMELTAQLVARITGAAEPTDTHRVQALLLHASMTAFSTTRPVSARFLGAEDDTAAAIELALANIDAQIDAIGS